MEKTWRAGFSLVWFGLVWYSWAGIESCTGLINDLEGLLYLYDKKMSSEAH